MLNNMFSYIALFFISTTVLFFGVSKYRLYELEASKEEVKQIKKENAIRESDYAVESFESNQSITFNIEKGVELEEIPSSVGVHAISVD